MDADYAATYERLYREHWWWRARECYLRDVLRRYTIPADSGALDVGCGGGWAFPIWSEYGEVRGIEIDAVLANSDETTRENIYNGPLDNAFRPNRKFGLIVMLDVIEHIDDPGPVLLRAADLLIDDGILLITVPAHPSAWTHHDDMNHHYRRYTRSTLRKEVSAGGFDTLELRHFFHTLLPLKWAVRCKETLVSPAVGTPSVPPKAINTALRRLFAWEQRWITALGIPFGTSLLTVCQKKTTPAA